MTTMTATPARCDICQTYWNDPTGVTTYPGGVTACTDHDACDQRLQVALSLDSLVRHNKLRHLPRR